MQVHVPAALGLQPHRHSGEPHQPGDVGGPAHAALLQLHLRHCRGQGQDARRRLDLARWDIFYFSLHTSSLPVPFTGGLLLLLQAYWCCARAHPRPFTTFGKPIPRTGRHRELNSEPHDLQTSALPTELTGRNLRGIWSFKENRSGMAGGITINE